jgi:hypothetical protein
MDLKLRLKRTNKLVVPSPKRDSIPFLSFPGAPVPGPGLSRPSGTGLPKSYERVGCAFPLTGLDSFSFPSRHSRDGPWIVPSRRDWFAKML